MKTMIPQSLRARAPRIWRRCRAGLLALCATAAFLVQSHAGVTGAIFTTDIGCNAVNGNIFCSKTEVYLNGGPSHPKSAGLPDGEYYIRVTEPSGLPVLGESLGKIRETYTVLNGKFTECFQLYQATEFADTSNPGGEYKVWISMNPQFPPDESKTDNFKVRCTKKCGTICTDCIVVGLNPFEICETKKDAKLTAFLDGENQNVTYTWSIDGVVQDGEVLSSITIQAIPGEHIYSVVATDADAQCSDSAQTTVTVFPEDECDRAGCQIKCPVDIEVECGGSTLPSATGSAECTDGCEPTFSDSDKEECGDTKEITRTWYCTEQATGFYTKCTQTIKIVDTTKPTISCPVDQDVQCAADVPAPDITKVIASDTCSGPATVEWVNDQASGPTCNQVITRTYKATDACGNSKSCEQKFFVKDTTPPEITDCPATVDVQCVGDVPPPDIGLVKATDNCGGQVTISWVCDEPSGTDCDKLIVRTYKAADSCGNAAYCKQNIKVKDTIKPTITPVAVTPQCYDPYNPLRKIILTAPAVTDNCSSGLIATPSGIPAGDLYPLGTTTITWTVQDACGNEQKVTQDITVKVCACPLVNGLSKGYWGNNNGSKTLGKNDDAWRKCINGLNLRKADGTSFTVGILPTVTFANAYNPFNTWLQAANAVNMANMLSAQLAAVKLDVSFASPPVNGSLTLFIPASLTTGGSAGVAATLFANSTPGFIKDIQGNGYLTINDLIAAAKAELGLHPVATASGAIRTYQEAMKDLLDAICNNNIKTVCP